MIRCLEAELSFYAQVFGFEPADEIEQVRAVEERRNASGPCGAWATTPPWPSRCRVGRAAGGAGRAGAGHGGARRGRAAPATPRCPPRKAGARVTGLDLSPALLEIARERAADARLELEWVEGDAERLPFADAGFDRVLSTFGHMFAPDHRRVAAEMRRVCRPGGALGSAAGRPRARAAGCTAWWLSSCPHHRTPHLPPSGVPSSTYASCWERASSSVTRSSGATSRSPPTPTSC